MPKVRVGDISMYYVEAGAGEPLVLIMGLGADHLAWGFQVPAFAERYRVIAFDNRGAGQSEAPDHPYTTRMMADDTVGLMDVLGVDRAHVLGASLGGMIAQEIALNHSARIRSLQLHCTLGRPDSYLRAQIAAGRVQRRKMTREEAMRAGYLWLFTPPTYNERPEFVEMILQNALANPYPMSLTGFEHQCDAVETHDTLDRVATIRCPTLISVADADILVPSRFSRALAARIPGAEFRLIEGAGHGYFWERSDVFNAMCVDFLSSSRVRREEEPRAPRAEGTA
jgi:pimeloyl-ACP methyl ester carboxylesterase